jgi:hypothetical protein
MNTPRQLNISTDEFRLTIAESLPKTTVTKRMIVSDVAKVLDVLGWFSPVTIKMKILLQRIWEIKLDWDDPIPDKVHQIWSQWRSELLLLTTMHVPRCYKMPLYRHNCTVSMMPRKMLMVASFTSVLKIPQTKSILHWSFPKLKFLQSSSYPFPD